MTTGVCIEVNEDCERAKATKPKAQMRRIRSQQLGFRRGAESRATGVYIAVNEDCERAKATKPKAQMRRANAWL